MMKKIIKMMAGETLGRIKLIALCLLILSLPITSYSQLKYTCGYISADKKNQTIIQFQLPKLIKFGQKVVLNIQAENLKDSNIENMSEVINPNKKIVLNSVVIRDEPYVVLTDLKKIKEPNSIINLIMFKKDADSNLSNFYVSNVTMGNTALLNANIGKCVTRK